MAKHNITGKKKSDQTHTNPTKLDTLIKQQPRAAPPSSVYSRADVVLPADRFQSGEPFLPAQERRCQKDPQPAGTFHPPPGQDGPPTPQRVSTECSAAQ